MLILFCSSLIAYYEPVITSASEYYPFGMMMRQSQAGKYRFGFNGKENDNEVKGLGNQQDYGMRIYDGRLGRFLSVDPITRDYPDLTPYQFSSNDPISNIDLDGLEGIASAIRFAKIKEGALRQANASSLLKPVIATQEQINGIRYFKPNNSEDKSWKQNWRDSKNILANITYDIANGLYTLPQQLTASVRNDDYITSIGGDSYRAHGLMDEKTRVKNFINGATTLVPGSATTKAEGVLSKYTNNVLKGIENEVTEYATKTITEFSVDDKLARYLLEPNHAIGGSKAKWFEKALGFTKDNASELAKQIVFDPNKAIETAVTKYGTKYNQVISITGANGKVIDVTFVWIKNNDGAVRLVSGIPTKL